MQLGPCLQRVPVLSHCAQTMERWRRRNYEMGRNRLGTLLHFATKCVDLLLLTSGGVPQPFLAAAMRNRIAEMLNYFLSYLVGPARSQLRISDPEEVRHPPLRVCCTSPPCTYAMCKVAQVQHLRSLAPCCAHAIAYMTCR